MSFIVLEFQVQIYKYMCSQQTKTVAQSRQNLSEKSFFFWKKNGKRTINQNNFYQLCFKY